VGIGVENRENIGKKFRKKLEKITHDTVCLGIFDTYFGALKTKSGVRSSIPFFIM
jgi:hypothetical protein